MHDDARRPGATTASPTALLPPTRAPEPFDRATAVHLAADGTYGAVLDPTWAIGDHPHGGYLLAVGARAAVDAVSRARGDDRHRHVLSTSALFLRSPGFGPAHLDVEVLRTGRAVSHAQVTLVHDGAPCVRSLHVLGRLDPATEPGYLDETPPELPAWEDCPPLPRPPAPASGGGAPRVGIAEVADLRLDPSSLGEAGPPAAPRSDGPAAPHRSDEPSAPRRSAELRAWQSFRDGREPDPLSLLFTLDALPPVTVALGSFGWVPTLELTAYVRALPAPGPLRVRQRGRLLQDGRLDEVCDVWDSADRLVGQASQLAAVRTGPPA